MAAQAHLQQQPCYPKRTSSVLASLVDRITRIFFDTNVLHQAWPRLGVKVENTLVAARKLGVLVEIPQPVLHELSRNWRARTKEDLEQAKRILGTVGWLLNTPSIPSTVPDVALVTTACDRIVEETLRQWGIAITAFPAIATEHLFTQAAEKTFVFGEKGLNFQDAVILHAVIERLAGTSDAGAFISDDRNFDQRKSDWQSYAEAKSASLQVLTLQQLEEHFNHRLSETERMRMARHKNLAHASVVAYLPTLGRLFSEHRKLTASIDRSSTLTDVIFSHVVDVDVAVADDDPEVDSEVRLSAIVRGTVLESVERPWRDDVRTHSSRKSIELGISASAKYFGDRYEIVGVYAMTYGWPSSEGSVGHVEFPDSANIRLDRLSSPPGQELQHNPLAQKRSETIR